MSRRFADRLAVVDRLDHRDQPRMALDHAGKGIEVAGACMARQLGPGPLRLACRRDRVVHVLGAALGDLCQTSLPVAGSKVSKALPDGRRDERAVDEVAELAFVARQPLASFGVGFRCGTIGHFVKIPCDCHRDHPIGCRLRAE